MKIYVASSWRNIHQPNVVSFLRFAGHEVYDFRYEGFSWREVDGDWQKWSIAQYQQALKHPCAERGFERDMRNLRECDACVYVMPCGPSASMEIGWACGAGKISIVYIPELREPDLMVKMADYITDDLDSIAEYLDSVAINRLAVGR